jgi:hypothetical protein
VDNIVGFANFKKHHDTGYVEYSKIQHEIEDYNKYEAKV